MRKQQTWPRWMKRGGQGAAGLCLGVAMALTAQQSPVPVPQEPTTPGAQSGANAKPGQKGETAKPETHITPEQAKQLFALVDQLLLFSSDETGLPVKAPVKRQLTTRADVERYLKEKLDDDQDSKRMQEDEIVLKKFGLLDRDFALKPFMLALLKEQIEAYYDSKTKTVNLLDWVDADEQKPVLAHELTHALQDQHANLEKWDDQTPDEVSTDAAGDQDHLARDEMDTARDAVAEGQATAVMIDYMLKPSGKSLVKNPEIVDFWKDQMSGSDSPVMSRAPLLLSESMLFPYKEGVSFEQDVWMDEGRTPAFAGALDRPPTSSWEIINPRVYEKHEIPAIPLLPNIHPLVDSLYRPYDIGQVGQLDLHIIAELFGGDQAARDLTSAWNGGIYWAGQLRSATTPAAQDSTKSLAIFYLSVWKNRESAQDFAKLYADSLGRKYTNVKLDKTAADTAPAGDSEEQVYSTEEGPVMITVRGKLVFVAESFPLGLARKLAALILDAQGVGDMRTARLDRSGPILNQPPTEPLSAGFVRFFESCGVMKAAVDAAMRTSREETAR
jgi:hypothetical protein